MVHDIFPTDINDGGIWWWLAEREVAMWKISTTDFLMEGGGASSTPKSVYSQTFFVYSQVVLFVTFACFTLELLEKSSQVSRSQFFKRHSLIRTTGQRIFWKVQTCGTFVKFPNICISLFCYQICNCTYL